MFVKLVSRHYIILTFGVRRTIRPFVDTCSLIRHREKFSLLHAFTILPDKTALFSHPPICTVELCAVCMFVLYLKYELNSNSFKV